MHSGFVLLCLPLRIGVGVGGFFLVDTDKEREFLFMVLSVWCSWCCLCGVCSVNHWILDGMMDATVVLLGVLRDAPSHRQETCVRFSKKKKKTPSRAGAVSFSICARAPKTATHPSRLAKICYTPFVAHKNHRDTHRGTASVPLTLPAEVVQSGWWYLLRQEL